MTADICTFPIRTLLACLILQQNNLLRSKEGEKTNRNYWQRRFINIPSSEFVPLRFHLSSQYSFRSGIFKRPLRNHLLLWSQLLTVLHPCHGLEPLPQSMRSCYRKHYSLLTDVHTVGAIYYILTVSDVLHFYRIVSIQIFIKCWVLKSVTPLTLIGGRKTMMCINITHSNHVCQVRIFSWYIFCSNTSGYESFKTVITAS